jgi:hypothetical protein
MSQEAPFDTEEFQKEWIVVAEEIVKELMAHPEIEKIKQKVRSQGHVAVEDRDQFINLVNEVKYDVIHKRYGEEDSDDYKHFVKAWQHWQKLQSSHSHKPENMFEDNIYHLLFGSTPDPDKFLQDFDVNK